MKPAPDYDTWLQRPYMTEPDGSGDFDFCTRLRGGTVRVRGESEWQTDADEDGPCKWLKVTIQYVNWPFDEDFEVELTKEEKEHLKGVAQEYMEDY